jgi:septum formation protein
VVPDVQECESGDPAAVTVENAVRKAAAVAGANPGRLVLGVDTVVCLGKELYGKPADRAQARATLTALAGRRHTVLSGLCLIEDGAQRTAVAETMVRFRTFDETVLNWYLESDEWRERAGGYAIQGRGAALVQEIEGDYSNVVGLPVPKLLELAPELLTDLRAHASPDDDL